MSDAQSDLANVKDKPAPAELLDVQDDEEEWGGDNTPSKAPKEATAKAHDELAFRRNAGIGLGASGCIIVLAMLLVSDCSIHETIDAFTGKGVDPSSPTIAKWSLTLACASLATHTVVSVAGVYFAYQLIRAAERLLLPSRFMNPQNSTKNDVEMARALMGMTEPSRAATNAVKQMAKELERAAKVTKAFKSITSDVAGTKASIDANVAPQQKDKT